MPFGATKSEWIGFGEFPPLKPMLRGAGIDPASYEGSITIFGCVKNTNEKPKEQGKDSRIA
ncbi:MAG: hypothetical protein Ct9H90mP30_2510 [Actinomycetota bacterium]|nr:MAG: hypothetical protein Ct9H90mP30_2510 [Actinomycetota bacterium]